MEKRAKGGDKESLAALRLANLALAQLAAGRPARAAKVADDDEKAWRMLQLLTAKPALYVCNVEEAAAGSGNALSAKVKARAAQDQAKAVVISAKIESEIALLDPAERIEFLETLGLAEPGLDRLIREAYALLGLRTYFTAGPKEARAWTIPVGATGPQAAGVIHTDFEKGFIRAETIAFDDYVTLGGEAGAREAGKLRSEGKEYVVRDGDVANELPNSTCNGEREGTRQTMGEIIKITSTASDGFVFDAYHAAPAAGRKGGVIVVQEIFGLDEHVRRDVDRWASLGFEAVAPATSSIGWSRGSSPATTRRVWSPVSPTPARRPWTSPWPTSPPAATGWPCAARSISSATAMADRWRGWRRASWGAWPALRATTGASSRPMPS